MRFKNLLVASLILVSPLIGSAEQTNPITEYYISSSAEFYGIASGPDRHLWFTDDFARYFDNINLAGDEIALYPFSSPDPSLLLTNLIFDHEGNIWIAAISLSSPNVGMLKKFKIEKSGHIFETIMDHVNVRDLMLGADGNIWYAGDNAVSKITPDGKKIVRYPVCTESETCMLMGLSSDANGNIWFTEYDANVIGKITVDGTITKYTVPTLNSNPSFITLGSDRNMWFTEANGNKIAKINPNTGTITEYEIPTKDSEPAQITKGIDGNIWFSEHHGNKIGRISMNGEITEYPIPTTDSHPMGITTGADGNIWFVEQAGGRVGKLEIPAR